MNHDDQVSLYMLPNYINHLVAISVKWHQGLATIRD